MHFDCQTKKIYNNDMKKLLFNLATLIFLTHYSTATAQTNVLDSVQHQLQWRTYKLHIPTSYNGSSPFPLVIALHGGGHTADTMEYITNFSQKADASNFIVVYPNGRKFGVQTWNAGTCCGNSVTFNIDDVGFIVKMIDSLKTNYNIDTNKIYVTGASNGGMLAYRLACEKANLFAAVAPVAATMVTTITCSPSRVVPILHVHSLIDTHVPYMGGYGTGFAGVYMPPIDSITSVWAANDTCIGTLDTIYNTGGAVGKKWMNCSTCSEVLIYTTTDGGHSWPGGNQTSNGDPISTQLNATDLIWNFFSQHSLICSITAINEPIETEHTLSIYPNPSNGLVKVNTTNQKFHSIKIYNLIGELLQEHFTTEFSITNLPNGIYLTITQTDKSTFINKLIKQ
jgi:polyhydroxybutyrate depolymerase